MTSLDEETPIVMKPVVGALDFFSRDTELLIEQALGFHDKHRTTVKCFYIDHYIGPYTTTPSLGMGVITHDAGGHQTQDAADFMNTPALVEAVAAIMKESTAMSSVIDFLVENLDYSSSARFLRSHHFGNFTVVASTYLEDLLSDGDDSWVDYPELLVHRLMFCSVFLPTCTSAHEKISRMVKSKTSWESMKAYYPDMIGGYASQTFEVGDPNFSDCPDDISLIK